MCAVASATSGAVQFRLVILLSMGCTWSSVAYVQSFPRWGAYLSDAFGELAVMPVYFESDGMCYRLRQR